MNKEKIKQAFLKKERVLQSLSTIIQSSAKQPIKLNAHMINKRTIKDISTISKRIYHSAVSN